MNTKREILLAALRALPLGLAGTLALRLHPGETGFSFLAELAFVCSGTAAAAALGAMALPWILSQLDSMEADIQGQDRIWEFPDPSFPGPKGDRSIRPSHSRNLDS